jgi:hypothetical protein
VTDEKYAGFLPHIERYLGEAREFEEPTVTGRNRGFGLFFCHSPDGKLLSVVTNGLRFQRITAVIPQELVCTVQARHRKAAHLLVALTAELVIRRNAGLILDEVVPSPAPIVPGTAIEGIVAANHPYVDDDGFDALTGADGRVELQILTLIPALRPELELTLRSGGIDALYAAWEEQGTNLLDVNRASAVQG